jgi:hypothetical protein
MTTPGEMNATSKRVHDFMRREWEALTAAREKMEETIASAKTEYDQAASEYHQSISCTTCGHHKGHKTFKESCPRVKELLFLGGNKSATQVMDETKIGGCLYHQVRQ